MRRILSILIGLLTPTVALAAAKHLSDYGFDCSKIGLPMPGCGAPIDLVTAISLTIGPAGAAIATPLATVVFLYGAIRMVISRGDEGKEAGKKAMIYGAMGLGFVMLAVTIVLTVEWYVRAI